MRDDGLKRSTFSRVAVMGVLCFVILSPAAAQEAAFDPDDYLKVERLSDRVLIVGMGGEYYDAVCAVATERGIVVIDAGRVPSVTRMYREVIARELGREDFAYLINTHGHFDHTTGNRAFSDAVIIGHENIQSDIEGFWADSARVNRFITRAEPRLKQRMVSLEAGSGMWRFYRMLVYQMPILIQDLAGGYTPAFPSITFDDRMSLHLGDMTFHLVYFGRAHTTSDILIHVPEEKILFVGDLFDAGGEPDFDVEKVGPNTRWHEVMDWLTGPEVEIETIVYGHGTTLTMEDLEAFGKNIGYSR